MGCEETLTFEDTEQFDKAFAQTRPKNLLIRTYTGILTKEKEFTDTIIKSNEELNKKLRDYIPSQIDLGNDRYDYNLSDDILTKSATVNFNEEYIIAINGVNKVLRVEENEGNYIIYHDNQQKEKNSYVDLVVKKISGDNPKFFFASPKRPFI